MTCDGVRLVPIPSLGGGVSGQFITNTIRPISNVQVWLCVNERVGICFGVLLALCSQTLRSFWVRVRVREQFSVNSLYSVSIFVCMNYAISSVCRCRRCRRHGKKMRLLSTDFEADSNAASLLVGSRTCLRTVRPVWSLPSRCFMACLLLH